jgi:hypothetical protein
MLVTLLSAAILGGCGQAPQSTPEASPPAVAPRAEGNATKPPLPGLNTQTTTAHAAPPAGFSAAPPQLSAPMPSLAQAQAQVDPVLRDIGRDLKSAVEKIGETLTGSAPLKEKLDQVLQGVTDGHEGNAVDSFQQVAKQVTDAQLTPEQTGLVKRVGEALSAFVVQKNLGGLEGSENEIGQIVSALRNGEPAAAIPYLQKVASNARLTDDQKQMLSGLVEQYAPSVQGAIKSLQENLKGLKF